MSKTLTCTLGGGPNANRVAAGRSIVRTGVTYEDLALLHTAGGEGALNPGVYWLRNQGDGGFEAHLVATVPAVPGKLAVVRGSTIDSIAILQGRTLTAWSGVDGGATPVLTAIGVDDLTTVQMKDWTTAGLVTVGYETATGSTVTRYPSLASGSATAWAEVFPSKKWLKVRGWASWLMLAGSGTAFDSNALTYDGGLADAGMLSPQYATAQWVDALSGDIDQRMFPKWVMDTGSTLALAYAGAAPQAVSPILDIRSADGGIAGNNRSMAIGTLIPGTAGTLGVVTAAGAFRLYGFGPTAMEPSLPAEPTRFVGLEEPEPAFTGTYEFVTMGRLHEGTRSDAVLIDTAGTLWISAY